MKNIYIFCIELRLIGVHFIDVLHNFLNLQSIFTCCILSTRQLSRRLVKTFFFFLADGAGVITFFCQADAVTTTTIMTSTL